MRRYVLINRRKIKQAGRTAFLSSFWKCVAAALILGLAIGGNNGPSGTNFGYNEVNYGSQSASGNLSAVFSPAILLSLLLGFLIVLLIGVLIFTIVVTMVGWMQFDNWNRCMYVLLIVSLGLTYVRRHAKLSETQAVFAERASLVSIGFAIAMFVIVLLHNFNFF